MPLTLYRYLLKEIIPYFLVGLLTFTLVLLMQRVIFIVGWIVQKGVPVLDVVRLFGCMLPNFFILTLPTALLLGVLLTFSRVYADNELYALKAAGMSLYRLLPPVYLFGGFVAALSLFLTTWAGPKATQEFQSLFISMATKNVFFGLQERVFFDGIPGHVMYVEHLDNENHELKGVLMKDLNFPEGPIYYFAEKGRVLEDSSIGKVVLELENGTMQRIIPSDGLFQLAAFDRYRLQVDLGKLFASRKPWDRKDEELTLGELRERVREFSEKGQDVRRLLLNYHQRFSLPFGAIVFCTIAVPLSLLSQRAVRYTGFSLSILVILVYYVFMQVGTGLILANRLPVLLGAWIPNIVLGLLGVYLLWKKAEEKPTEILDLYADVVLRIQDAIRKRLRPERETAPEG